jgi:hypothetical protein
MVIRAVIAATALFAVASVPAQASRAPAHIALSNGVVHGSHFRSRERVSVRMTTSTTVVRTVRATTAGTFNVAALPRDPCNDELVVVAVGATGDSAKLHLMPRACPPGNSAPRG